MTIGKKLYVNFGAILAMVLVLFLINLVAVQREHSAKAAASQALALADATDKVKFQIMQNRLYLSNYLLSGDTREADRMNDGIQILSEKLQSTRALSNSEQERVALDHVHETEQNWAREFALPLVEKRKEVDAGNATDLDHMIDIKRNDEIGELARTFSKMVTYLKEMATVSEAIAGGNLNVVVQPRSKDDTLGNAFVRMIEGLRSLVFNVRDAASQVASASSQVAGASDESAKISLQTASAIDEVTS